MTLSLLDDYTALNLDAIATVRFSEDPDNFTATVQFRTQEKTGGAFLSETLSSQAATNLHKLLSSRKDWRPSTSESEGLKSESVAFSTSPIQGQFSRNKTWCHFVAPEGRQYFIAFVNVGASCTMRRFDAQTGEFLGTIPGSGKYQKQFAEIILNARELSVKAQPNLARDCKERLPEAVLAHLKQQLK